MGAQAVIFALLAVSQVASSGERTPQELRVAVRQALRRQATATGSEQVAAVQNLVRIHGELRSSTRMLDDEKRELSGIVRSRLLRTGKDLERELEKAAAGKSSRQLAPASVASPDKQAILAQVRGNPGARPAVGAGPNVGGPAVIGAAQGPAGVLAGMTAENAQQLIELIENTVAPGSWEARGGPGTMVYFAPKMVLVARQSEEVHEQIGQLLQALRGM